MSPSFFLLSHFWLVMPLLICKACHAFNYHALFGLVLGCILYSMDWVFILLMNNFVTDFFA